MTYNLSFADNVTGIQDIATGMNDLTGGWLFGIILISIWMIIIFSIIGRAQGNKDAIGEGILASSFIISIVGGVIMGLGYLAPWALAFPIIGVIIGLMITVWGR